MTKLTLEQALITFEKATKQQLERTLKSRNIMFSSEGKGKNTIYTIHSSLDDTWENHFGFTPARKTAVKELLIYLNNFGAVMLSDRELAKELKINQGTLTQARLELVRNGFLVETQEQRRLAKEEGAYTIEHRIAGQEVSLQKVGEYFSKVRNGAMEILVEEDVFLSDSKIVESSVLKQVAQEEGQYTCVVLKQLKVTLTEEQIDFLQKQ